MGWTRARPAVLDESRIEVEMLRNRGCDKLYEDEDKEAYSLTPICLGE